MTKTPYTCPRCGLETRLKGNMSKHLYGIQKPCPAASNDIDLTPEIKEHILNNRVYRPHKQSKSSDVKRNKKSKIRPALRVAVWNTYIGEEIGKTTCCCCKSSSITQLNFHCGHVIAEANGGKVQIDNLRPICVVCNNSMGTMDMKIFALENFNVIV